MPTGLPIRDEASEQKAFATWAESQTARWPELAFWYHVPNGEARPSKRDAKGKRYSNAAKRLKEQGAKKGVPDICLDVPRRLAPDRATPEALEGGGSVQPGRSWHGLRIELKKPAFHLKTTGGETLKKTRRGSLDPAQKQYRDFYRAQGYAWFVAYGAREAQSQTEAYLSGRVARDPETGAARIV